MGRLDKTLFSFDFPEFMGSTCVTGWTYVPCPTWSNPTRVCRHDIRTPCLKTKNSRFRVYAELNYPDNLEEFLMAQLERCHELGVAAATELVVSAITAASAGGPQAQIAAGIAAVPPATQTYLVTFWECLSGFSISDAIRREINGKIDHETITLNDWH